MDFVSRLKVIEAECHDDSNQYYPREVLGFVNAKSKAFCSVCKLLFDSVSSHISSILSGQKSSHRLVSSVIMDSSYISYYCLRFKALSSCRQR